MTEGVTIKVVTETLKVNVRIELTLNKERETD